MRLQLMGGNRVEIFTCQCTKSFRLKTFQLRVPYRNQRSERPVIGIFSRRVAMINIFKKKFSQGLSDLQNGKVFEDITVRDTASKTC